MKNPPRFLAPLSISRPRGARVIEGFSPKLGRRLQCFGQQACDQWILLETDPSVLTFCERPTQVTTTTGRHLVDYWVQDQREERFLCIGNSVVSQSVMVGSTAIPVRHILSIELAAAHVWIKNWERILL